MQAVLTMGDWIAQRTARGPGRKALTYEGSTWTYGELLDRIDRLAAALASQGVQRGERVAFLAFNHADFFVAMFAAARLGAVFVPLNFRLTGPELAFIINDAAAHTLIVGAEHREIIESVRGELCCKAWFTLEHAAEGWQPLHQAIEATPPLTAPAPVDGDDVAIIMYTSGTTGRPKGAMLTHANMWAQNVNELLTMDVQANDVMLTFAPVFHIGGLNVMTLTVLVKGGHVILHKTFDPGRILRDVAEYRPTLSFAVPAMLLFLTQHPDFADADMSSLRIMGCGGAPCPEGLLRIFSARGIPVQQGYGLTETAPMVSMLTPDWAEKKLGSAGMPPMMTQVRVVDGEGRVIDAPDVKGEICVRGPNVMKGYWNRPDATREALDEEGWFRTGDVGYRDADGFYYICDRVKDMIISGGENIYPAEVESVLFGHPAVAEVAVIGTADEKWGEAVVAVAALKPGMQLTLAELQEFAAGKLARYKLPRHLRIVDALPRNPTGKVLKYRLRELCA